MLTLYDFHTTLPGQGLSVYTWRIRLALNIKGIAHKTEWVQYADVEKRLKELGIPPTEFRADGTVRYTVPAIHDPSTGVWISDSPKILAYLDKQYPDTRKVVIPEGTEVLMAAFHANILKALRPIWPLTCPPTIAGMVGESSDKYRLKLETALNTTLEAFVADKEAHDKMWVLAEEAFAEVDGWFKRASSRGPWIMGSELTVADLILGGGLAWIVAVFGEDGEEWKRISSWNESRWGKYWEQIKQYAKVY